MVLSPIHHAMLTAGSAITEAVIVERGYRSITGAEGMAELKRLGFPATHARLSPGLLLPLHTTDGQQPFSIFRPDTPGPDANHRPRKYLFPR
jgi:hypothetical protein